MNRKPKRVADFHGKPGKSGRPPKPVTVIKRFIESHPNAYEELMNKLYSQGKEGDITAAQYVCDRLKGKPGVKIDLDIGVKPYDTLIKEIATAIPLQLGTGDDILGGKEVEDAIQERGSKESLQQGTDEEGKGNTESGGVG